MNDSPASDATLFNAALDRVGRERAAFLDEACRGDQERRARIDALLRAHHSAPESLAGPIARAAADGRHQEVAGDQIGRYKLLLKIGEGGCGIVFMAEQEEPVRRRVALKVIKAGMDTREVVARFEAERQALALMDHPGICKVLDAGATAAGRPFFVMELVRGVPITKFCDEGHLAAVPRLQLFIEVCHAVQHAHQKGIIHRDLKPSNILVGLNDTTPAPKVIDFGIAKATQGRLTDSTLVTACEHFIGTPAYMSPEQAEMSGLDIDTRSDVYSLGVLLYELLTGRPPFDPKTLLVASRDELRRIIREVEPPKPSTHLATLPALDRTTIAQRRATEPAKLRLLLSGDLDWIVMKALEKNRVRRYETPAALADDIARYLGNEPVVARPPGTLYRTGKFVRRHRVGVAAGTAVVVALVAGTIISTAQAVRAKQAEHMANEERSRAIAARMRAENLLDFMLEDLRTEVRKVGKLDVLDMVGEKATAYFASLDPRDLTDKAQLQQAKTLRQIGEVQIDQARYEAAMQSFATAYARVAALTERFPRNGDILFERGQTEYWIGMVHRKRRELTAMGDWWTRYRDTGVSLVKLDPNRAAWQGELAWGLHNLAAYDFARNKAEDARRGFLAELEILSKLVSAAPNDVALQFRVVDANSWLGSTAELTGNLWEAGRCFSQQVSAVEAITRLEPDNPKWRASLGEALALRATIHAVTGQRANGLEGRRRVSGIFRDLAASDPKNLNWEKRVLDSYMREARLLVAEGSWAEARRIMDEMFPRLERLAATEPTDAAVAASLAMGCRIRAELLHAAGHPGASALIARAIEQAERIVGKGAAKAEVIGELVRAYLFSARAAAVNDDAVAALTRAQELIETPANISTHWQFLDAEARTRLLQGDTERAAKAIGRLRVYGYVPLEPWDDQAR